jgi:carbamoyl-phosphate synthase small subunit
MTRTKALLVLADGTYFEGESFGFSGETIGEVVFNTSMSGYQEILTDPSYRGQLVTMTANHIGNYGCNPLDVESDQVQAAGFIVREASRRASNYRATHSLEEYLIENETVGIMGVDTRAITRKIRDAGATMAAIVHDATADDVDAIVEKIQAAPDYGSRDFVAEVSVKEPKHVRLEPTEDQYAPYKVSLVPVSEADADDDRPHVVVWDFGVKYSILEELGKTGLRLTLMPHTSTHQEILDQNPDGVLISNGPGDPALLEGPIEEIGKLLGSVPVFGICLGHQLIGRAVGGTTYKLKFGHRGPNQPVMVEEDGRVEITSQNHGYTVELDDVDGVTVTHRNLNDDTVEGLYLADRQCFSVQHHPEAGPGPHDSQPMFAKFRSMIRA